MKRIPWRALLYLVILLYLLADLRWCRGPIYQKIQSRRQATSAELALKNGWIAIVNQEPITSLQLDVALFRYLYQRGKRPEEIPDATLKMMRRAVVQTLINDTLVRHYADGANFNAPKEEIDRFIESWESQFSSPEDRKERMAIQNLSESDMKAELGRIWSRKRWIEAKIKPGVSVSEEEVREWFEANRKEEPGFTEPEKVHARHIFISTVEVDDDVRKKIIFDAYARLIDAEKPADFAEVAAEVSEDERSKLRGGDLNWFTRERMPKDFCDQVFSLKKGALSEPFHTKIGWHIVEVLDRQEARPVEFKDVQDDILAHLENEQREAIIDLLMQKYRKVAKIELFPENI